MDAVQAMGQFTPTTTLLAIPDAPGTKRTGPPIKAQLVVGTPGKVLELIRRKKLLTPNVAVFVLDEADKMFDVQGLGDQSMKVKNTVPRTCQIVLFSATFPDYGASSPLLSSSSMITFTTGPS